MKQILINRKIALEKSLCNCHSIGLDSLVLNKMVDGCLTRVFVANENHELWKNGLDQNLDSLEYFYSGPLSIGIHGHHVDIEIIPLLGRIYNLKFDNIGSRRLNGKNYGRFRWNTPIGGGEGKFEYLGDNELSLNSISKLSPGSNEKMASNELHTIFVEKQQRAIWMIVERPASKGYEPFTYSNAELEDWNPIGLYEHMTETRVDELIAEINDLSAGLPANSGIYFLNYYDF